MKKKWIYVVLVVLVLPYTGYIVSAESGVTIVAPAVQRTSSGLQGVLSYVTVVTQKGSGHIYIDTWPLAEVDIQGSARLAVQVACEVVQKDYRHYDFFITVRSDSPIIGGPSAGGAITVAVIASLQGWNLRSDVVMSGTINPDETVGPVGGLFQKAQAASEIAHTFLVPEGQTTIVVEEQKITQEGPFTFVNTVQKEVDLVKEGKNMGVTVEEVYDIREAVYYFTGKRIEAPVIEGEPIKTGFMKEYAEIELQKIDKEYTTVGYDVELYTGEYKGDLQNLLISAREHIDRAHETFDTGEYYTSMSASFVAGLYIEYAKNLLLYFKDEPVEEIFSEVDTRINQLSQEIKSVPPQGMTSLQCIAAAQNRIYEAFMYYQRAKEQRSYFDYIEYASYAQRRAESAEFWLELAREYQIGDEIPPDVIKNAASSMISTAELSLVYASSILPESDLLKEAQTKLETAQNEFVKEAYCASLFSAVESKVHGEVALLSYATNQSVITQRVERAQERASAAIEESRKKGIEPVLAVSYYELAESFSSATRSLIYLGYAEETASIYRYIEGHPASVDEPYVSETPSGTEPPGLPKKTENSVENGLLLVGVGILIGICISWVVVRVSRH
ncbi:MAG: hypothetical protein PVF58_03735 [Candidatus Methanofastidiosia archaeon]